MGAVNWGSLKQQADDATKPVPAGDYPVQCTKAESKKASTGSDMIVLNLTIAGGEKAGRGLMSNIVFTPEKAFAMKMWFDRLGAFGLDDNFFASDESPSQEASLTRIAQALVGRTAIAEVGIKEYPKGSGTMRNEVTGFKPGAIVTIDSMYVPAGYAGGMSASVPPTPSVPSLPPTPQPAVSTSTPPQPAF